MYHRPSLAIAAQRSTDRTARRPRHRPRRNKGAAGIAALLLAAGCGDLASGDDLDLSAETTHQAALLAGGEVLNVEVWEGSPDPETFQLNDLDRFVDASGVSQVGVALPGTIDAAGYPVAPTSNSLLIASRNDVGTGGWVRRDGISTSSSLSAFDLAPPHVARTKVGRTLIIGPLTGTRIFGAGWGGLDPVGGVSLSADSKSSAFAAKYDTNGALMWAKRFGSSGSGYLFNAPTDVDITFGGHTFVGGRMEGAVYWNGSQELADRGEGNYVLRVRTTGTIKWARGLVSDDNYHFNLQVAGMPNKDVVVGGSFHDQVDIDTNGAGGTTTLSANGIAGYLVRYKTGGNLDWTRKVVGTMLFSDVVSAADGRVVTVGAGSGDVTFGPGEPNETTLNFAVNSGYFVAAYAGNGDLIFAKELADDVKPSPLYVTAPPRVAARQPADGIAVSGTYFEGATLFPGDPLQTVIPVVSPTNVDHFVAKVSSTGAGLWLSRTSSDAFESNGGLAMDDQGLVQSVGNTQATSVTVGVGQQNETTLGVTPDASWFAYHNL